VQPLILFAPGAGKPSTSPWMEAWAARLGALGPVVRLDYPRPFRMDRLVPHHSAALAAARVAHPSRPVVLAGKSMGSRVGCHLSLVERVDALVCFGYPLAGGGDRRNLRDEVLLALGTQVLFVQGTRDRLAPLDLLEDVRTRMTAENRLHIVPAGDHSLQVTRAHTKQTGRSQADEDDMAFAAVRRFVLGLTIGGGRREVVQRARPRSPHRTRLGGVRSALMGGPRSMPEQPATRRDATVERHHGIDIPDPYRWLEDPDGPEIANWIAAQNRHTDAYLEQIPRRAEIRQRLTEAYDYERISPPMPRAGWLWYHTLDGQSDHARLVRRKGLEDEPELVLDPNTFSEDGTRSLHSISVSPDGRSLAYAISDGGSDWITWRVRDMASGTDLPDVIRDSKFSGAPWVPDSSGFVYARFERPTGGTAANRSPQLFLHVLGTSQADDTLVFSDPDPEESFHVDFSEDHTLAVMQLHRGTSPKNRVWITEADPGGGWPASPFRPLLDAGDAEYTFVGNVGRRALFLTDAGAPRRRVVAVDLDRPGPVVLQALIEEHAVDTLIEVTLAGGMLVTLFLHHAACRLEVFEPDGTWVRSLPLPGLGSVDGLRGEPSNSSLFFRFTSYNHPSEVFRVDLATGVVTSVFAPKVPLDLSEIQTEQIFVTSADGTQVPAFLTWKGDRAARRNLPTLLYGYGGFNVPLLPTYDPSIAVWLDLGGAYVVANLRGGGEYGSEWHAAGTLDQKQNVFDDFIAVAEHLISTGFTSASRLAIHGRSNGGLLVGATMVQRPELFGAAVPSVGVLDMLRYQHWTIGWAWAPDYGTAADSPEMFQTLRAYSPLHGIREQSYPATLITTGDHDDRVVPAHSYKFAASLQAHQQGDAPVLLRIETRAGHGQGKSQEMAVSERTDMWSFLVRALGMP